MKRNRKGKRAARQLFRLCLADGRLDPVRVRRVAGQLAASRHHGALAMLTDFRRLVRLDHDRHAALIESARPLGESERAAIEADLAHRYGAGLFTSFAHNPLLIGGLRITVGSDVYDGSVRGRLDALQARL